MIPLISLRDFLEDTVIHSNNAMDEVLEKSAGMPITFVATSIELELVCSLIYKDNSVQIAPSNAYIANYYGFGKDSKLGVKFKLTPK